ncbi:MAG: aminotransferase class V-fold PLP-dependent enzyme [Bryobacteraceae bacterium]
MTPHLTTALQPNWETTREEFPSLTGWTYLNTATFGQLPRRADEAIERHLARRRDNACSDFLSWFADHDELRARLAQFISATPSDIAFMPNTSWALGHLLTGLDWRAGDEAVTAEGEFPNHLYAVEHLARRGVRALRCTYDELLSVLTPRTRLVLLSTVNYSTGYRAPVAELAAEFRKRGILFYLDATQSLGALRLNFQEIQPDLLAVNCYKWMLAPNGAAFMAVAPSLRQRLEPLAIGWRSHHEWRRVDWLHEGAPELVDAAEKYEAGMLASLPLYALGASLDLMLELGPDRIEERVLSLARETRTRIRALGGEPLPYDNTAIVAARFPGHDASALAARLKQQRVLVSARHGLLRVSTHFYNNEADLARFAEVLSKLL